MIEFQGTCVGRSGIVYSFEGIATLEVNLVSLEAVVYRQGRETPVRRFAGSAGKIGYDRTIASAAEETLCRLIEEELP